MLFCKFTVFWNMRQLILFSKRFSAINFTQDYIWCSLSILTSKRSFRLSVLSVSRASFGPNVNWGRRGQRPPISWSYEIRASCFLTTVKLTLMNCYPEAKCTEYRWFWERNNWPPLIHERQSFSIICVRVSEAIEGIQR